MLIEGDWDDAVAEDKANEVVCKDTFWRRKQRNQPETEGGPPKEAAKIEDTRSREHVAMKKLSEGDAVPLDHMKGLDQPEAATVPNVEPPSDTSEPI